MARRPLPRLDQTFDPSSPFSSRPTVSPFSETVRILNRKVKPREVKKGRVILNLKVVDKVGSGGVANSRRTHVPSTQLSYFGRQKIPSRNRVIGKNRRFGEVSYRGIQPPIRSSGFPVFGKIFDSHSLSNAENQTQSGESRNNTTNNRSSSQSSKVDASKGQTLDELPPSNSSSEVSDGEPPSPPQTQSQHSSLPPKASATKAQNPALHKLGAQPIASKNSSGPSALPTSPMFSSSSSASSSSEDNEHILDLSVPHEIDTRLRRHHPFSSRRPLKVPEVPVSEELSEEELDWRPDMISRCANVVVTDITANLLTVTIKEFCHPPSATPPPCYPKNISAQHDPKQPKHHPNKT